MRKYFCGTPESFCSGAKTAFSTPWPIGASQKTHGSANQAFKCYASYLLGQGYKKVGSREFETPDGSILVLTKKLDSVHHYDLEKREIE